MKLRILIAVAALASAGAAQIDDPEAKIRRILTKVQEEMAEIDKLLLQTKQQGGATKAAQESIAKTGKKIDELLSESKKSQEGVVKQIDELLEELHKMQQKSQQPSQDPSSGDEQKSQRPQSGEPMEDQQRSQQSEQNQTPDMVRQKKEQQDKQQQGQKQEQQNPQNDPRGPDKDKDRGTNRRDGTRPESGEERVPTVIDNQRWGLLPRYLEAMHARGGLPEVPEQYRRFYEEYLKEAQKQRGSRTPTGR